MIFDSSEIIQISDISHHQGYPPRFPVVDFVKMKQWGFKGCVMRASHGPFADRAFVYNWPACKGVLPRSSYHYYENWAAPKAQVKKYWEMVGADFEGIAWLDVEDKLRGDYGKWNHWYDWLEELKAVSGLPSERIGIYTGHYYFTDKMRFATAAQRAYFRQYMFWIAWYSKDPLKPVFSVIPPTLPWTDAQTVIVQTGTPVIGLAAGVGSKELDYNRVNGRSNYIKMFGNLEPTPEPEPQPGPGNGVGGTMKGVVKAGYTLNIRDLVSNLVIGKLNGGDTVYGDVANNRIAYNKVYRANGTVDTIAGSSAVGEGSTVWIVITAGTEPTPNPAPVPGLPVLNVAVSGEGYESVTVQLRPKV